METLRKLCAWKEIEFAESSILETLVKCGAMGERKVQSLSSVYEVDWRWGRWWVDFRMRESAEGGVAKYGECSRNEHRVVVRKCPGDRRTGRRRRRTVIVSFVTEM